MASFDFGSLRERTNEPDSINDRWRRIAPHNYLGAKDTYSLPSFQKVLPQEHVDVLDMDISSRFGRRVRILRQERNLTQTEMAKKFGIDRSYISDLERGRKSISLPMVEVIALGMDVSISLLFEDL